MSNTSNQSDPTGPDPARQQAEDALVDSVLNETLGAETPTDQRDVILRRVEESKTGLATSPTAPKRLIVYAAIAASLIFVSGTFVLPALMKNPQTAINLPDKGAQPKDKNLELDKEPVASAPGENSVSNRETELANSERMKARRAWLLDKAQLSQSAKEVSSEDSAEKTPVSTALQGLINDASSTELNQSTVTSDLSEIRSPQSLAPPNGYANHESQLFAKGQSSLPLNSSESYSTREPTNINRLSIIPNGTVDTTKIRSAERRLGSSSVFSSEVGSNAGTPKITYRITERRNNSIPERLSRSQYAPLQENTFIQPKGEEALSTFSIDVDTASYANTRQYLLQSNRIPPPNAVRIEELVNYFDYDYEGPEIKSEVPFAANMEVASCPWQPKHRLVRIAIIGREVEQAKRPLSNLVFLIDVSGSMNQPNKLPLVVRGLKQLMRRLGENDRVAIVVYASSEGLALDSTPGSERQAILSALDQLAAGGSTAGGAGINLAYKIAEDNFIKGGTNRVLLCTDGDFNVGLSNTDALGEMVETKAKESNVFLSVLGFGRGNLNDRMLEKITNQGNGNYSYIDSNAEARKVLVDQMTGTLVTIAKDVKIQVEFNPVKVSSYRLVGYENRVMANEDFNDDTKDAGEIGAGHTVTAFYEVVPIGVTTPGSVDPLKYQPTEDASTMNVEEPEASATGDEPEGNELSDELLTLKLRYKQPTEDESSKLEFILTDEGKSFDEASQEFRFASSVAQFGLLLRNSEYQGRATYQAVAEAAEASLGEDKHNYREEFLDMVDQAKKIE